MITLKEITNEQYMTQFILKAYLYDARLLTITFVSCIYKGENVVVMRDDLCEKDYLLLDNGIPITRHSSKLRDIKSYLNEYVYMPTKDVIELINL